MYSTGSTIMILAIHLNIYFLFDQTIKKSDALSGPVFSVEIA